MNNINFNEKYKKKYIIISIKFEQSKNNKITHSFPITKLFDSYKEANNTIEKYLDFKSDVFHSICPLYVIKEIFDQIDNDKDFDNCINLDSLARIEEQKIKNTKQTNETNIISIEQVYAENEAYFPSQ